MNLEYVIKQRMGLQSTQEALDKDFGVSGGLNFIKSNTFMSKYKNWPDDKKKKFIITLGGRANFNATKQMLENT